MRAGKEESLPILLSELPSFGERALGISSRRDEIGIVVLTPKESHSGSILIAGGRLGDVAWSCSKQEVLLPIEGEAVSESPQARRQARSRPTAPDPRGRRPFLVTQASRT
jgi:hypothetical protein